MTNNEPQVSMDLSLDELSKEHKWVTAHLLSVIVYLEDRFGPAAGEMISGVADAIINQGGAQEE